ncbi:hypothetical protein M422DRAFT_28989 [Sphaerobolus stellatus SS14]|uniref:Uncharacterized protein n=1 Tax=Sphaerobolus stellatus (strain SS14) TaxID=990650 RepID=A0A0C9VVA8_SPHS4|nr:hypothetical protein M422DRAFT_28989 [Sphaerobolus stellatus SS14]
MPERLVLAHGICDSASTLRQQPVATCWVLMVWMLNGSSPLSEIEAESAKVEKEMRMKRGSARCLVRYVRVAVQTDWRPVPC